VFLCFHSCPPILFPFPLAHIAAFYFASLPFTNSSFSSDSSEPSLSLIVSLLEFTAALFSPFLFRRAFLLIVSLLCVLIYVSLCKGFCVRKSGFCGLLRCLVSCALVRLSSVTLSLPFCSRASTQKWLSVVCFDKRCPLRVLFSPMTSRFLFSPLCCLMSCGSELFSFQASVYCHFCLSC